MSGACKVLLSEEAEEVIKSIGHDAALTDFQLDQRIVMDVVETHFVRYRKPALQHTVNLLFKCIFGSSVRSDFRFRVIKHICSIHLSLAYLFFFLSVLPSYDVCAIYFATTPAKSLHSIE